MLLFVNAVKSKFIMRKSIEELQHYLAETLGVRPEVKPLEADDQLPYFLQERYHFYRLRLLGDDFMLAVDESGDGESPAAIQKQLGQVEKQTGLATIYVRDALTSYNRQRLIERQRPFVIPGNQMYLPMLGMDLREHYRRPRVKCETLSPSAQAIFIYCLLNRRERHAGKSGEWSLGTLALAAALEYSAMTLIRAFDQLESAELAELSPRGRGRERHMRLADSSQVLWQKAQPMLKSPVRAKRNARLQGEMPFALIAGETALSCLTLLAEPSRPVWAMTGQEWQNFTHRATIVELPAAEETGVEIEIWHYSPTLLTTGRTVDKLSLYLSLRDEEDERIQIALKELMEGMIW